jgi:predicted alpha/beta superfamily hydrolase
MHRSIRLLIFILALLPSIANAQDIHVTISVVVHASSLRGGGVFVTGNAVVLGSWDASRIALEQQHDSVWARSFTLTGASDLEFKITRGSWNTEAIYERGVVPPNTKAHIVRDTLIVLRPLSWKDDEVLHMEGEITGSVRYLHELKGRGLASPRDVIVWLPPSYEKEKDKRYPVLYMHDGQNIIDPSTSFAQFDWRVDEIADSLIRAGAIEEPIIVGIYNTERRGSEYSDTPEGRAYAAFVIDSLKPLIDKKYRTRTDAGSTAVMGSSSGGLISFLFVWWHPEVFSMAGCLSSAFLVDSSKILKEVHSYSGRRKNIRVYLDVGGIGLEAMLKPGYDEMIALLKAKGYRPGIDLDIIYVPYAEHNERAWSQRIWKPLLFFFGSRN